VARQLARRQRRERLAGVLIAVVGVAVLIVAIVALRNPKQVSTQAGTPTRVVTSTTTRSASKSRSPSASTSASGGSGSRTATVIGSQPLLVLNDTTTANLGRDAASRFEGGGWNVTSYSENYRNDIISTCAYYDPSVRGAKTAALALQRQYPTIKRVTARFAQLPAGPIVVVLTADYSPN
jgi:hypothetical protein